MLKHGRSICESFPMVLISPTPSVKGRQKNSVSDACEVKGGRTVADTVMLNRCTNNRSIQFRCVQVMDTESSCKNGRVRKLIGETTTSWVELWAIPMPVVCSSTTVTSFWISQMRHHGASQTMFVEWTNKAVRERGKRDSRSSSVTANQSALTKVSRNWAGLRNSFLEGGSFYGDVWRERRASCRGLQAAHRFQYGRFFHTLYCATSIVVNNNCVWMWWGLWIKRIRQRIASSCRCLYDRSGIKVISAGESEQ